MKLKNRSYLFPFIEFILGTLMLLVGIVLFSIKMEGYSPLLLTSVGIAVILSCGFTLIFPKTTHKLCNTETTLLSAALSAFGACGAASLGLLHVIDTRREPIELLGVRIIGYICLLACLLVSIFYVVARIKKENYLGIFIDIALVMLAIFPFFMLFTTGYDIFLSFI